MEEQITGKSKVATDVLFWHTIPKESARYSLSRLPLGSCCVALENLSVPVSNGLNGRRFVHWHADGKRRWLSGSDVTVPGFPRATW